MKAIQYQPGQKLGNCIYLRDVKPRIEPSGHRRRKALFKCGCDNEFIAAIVDVKMGNTTTCGCSRKKAATKHGLKNHKLYSVWRCMKQRCYREWNTRYEYYGARGIWVCQEWIDDFKAYFDYVTSLPNALKEGYSLDRIENDKGYEPGNMQWVTHHYQTANRRVNKRNKTGYSGVFETPYRTFRVAIAVKGKSIGLGTYRTAKEAARVRDKYIIDNKLFEYPLSGA